MKETQNLPIGERVAVATPACEPAATVHTGTYVQLRPIDPAADAPLLFDSSHGDAHDWIWTYMPYGPFPGRSEMTDWLEEISSSSDPRFYTVCRQADQQPVGIVSFLRIDADHRCIEVGHIWYVPQVQRSEVNTESLYLLLKHAFDDLGFRRVEWKCDALNARSKAAALRLGFKAEGVFRQHRIVRGRNRDTAWFALLDHEWPAIRAHFETWLAAPATARPSLTALNRTA